MNTKVNTKRSVKTKPVTIRLPADFPVTGSDIQHFLERVGTWAGKFKSTPFSKEFQKDNKKFTEIFLKIDEYYAVTER
jgi:hypothetical protein